LSHAIVSSCCHSVVPLLKPPAGVRDEVQGLYFKITHIVLSTLWWLITIWVGMQMILQVSDWGLIREKCLQLLYGHNQVDADARRGTQTS
jgi:hypothetical protein